MDIYMHAFAEGSSIDTERFASPLNCSAPFMRYTYVCQAVDTFAEDTPCDSQY